MFVHGFACCVRRNAKIELDYLIKNYAMIYYDSCRNKPSDIRHNVLTYCVVRNLSTIFDNLMSHMKTTMYKTHQHSSNSDWQPHMAWREIIHLIIDPIVANEKSKKIHQLFSHGDLTTNYTTIGTVGILHTSTNEYLRCLDARKSFISKSQRRLPRAFSETRRQKPNVRRTFNSERQNSGVSIPQADQSEESKFSRRSKRPKNIFKTVNPLCWPNKSERKDSIEIDTISLVSRTQGDSSI